MSKMNSAEKFYIEKISEGYELINKEFTDSKILSLFSALLNADESFNKEIKRALDAIYIKESKGEHKAVIQDKYRLYAVKLYKGRETFLRESVVNWYSSNSMPNMLDSIKGLFK